MILETSVFGDIVSFITNTAKIIGFNWIAIIAFALLLITIVVSFVCTMFSIDAKTSKAVQQINLYLEKNPYINEENLVEFNKLMKKIPAPMRTQWQQYMVGRDKKPSQYFTEENCIDKPFKSSSYSSHILAVKVLTVCIAILAFVFSAGALAEGTLAFSQVLLQSVLISGLVAILGALYVLFLKSRRSALLFDLYYNFTNLKNYLDRAVTTLPDYVDYEILFTKKEIAAGIPVLQEYLKQRAEYEQQQIEHAKASQVEHEQYDFSALGVDAAIIMEKAMRECEYMLGNKKRILSEISELQSNLESYERTYDEKLKGTQRKLRDIQESLDRLKEKLQSTTNMIVGNDLRKQRENEIEKQRQVEKESAEDTRKFEESKKQILDQIEAKRAEIEEFRKGAEAVLNDEFRAYSDKIYKEIKGIADEQVKDELDTANKNIQSLQQELEDKERVLVEKTTLLNEQIDAEGYASELQTSYEELSNAYNDVLKELDEKDKQIAELSAKLGEQVDLPVEEQMQNEEQPQPEMEQEEQPVKQSDLQKELNEQEQPQEDLSEFFEGAPLSEEDLFGEPEQAKPEEVLPEQPEQENLPEQPEQENLPEQSEQENLPEQSEQENLPEQATEIEQPVENLEQPAEDQQSVEEAEQPAEVEEPVQAVEPKTEEEQQDNAEDAKAQAQADALARENQILSKQLENTQEILKAIVTDKPKKKSAKKPAKKATSEKKKSNKKADAEKKKPAKKAESKVKSDDKKVKAKRKTASSKYANKPWSEREEVKQQKPKASKKKKPANNGNDDGNLADLSLEQFNEQLKNAISDIASNQNGDKE